MLGLQLRIIDSQQRYCRMQVVSSAHGRAKDKQNTFSVRS